MPKVEDLASVVYREGMPTRADYTEAIQLLIAAQNQLEPDGQFCSVCADGDHQAFECHHNPLVMARRAVEFSSSWRCFHCNSVFTKWDEAQQHFGKNEDEVSECLRVIAAEKGAR